MMTVKELANLTGTSVRTLQYYDIRDCRKPPRACNRGDKISKDEFMQRLYRKYLLRRE